MLLYSCYTLDGDIMNVNERIINLRTTKKLSQRELAKKLYVSDKTISSWESGRTEPSLEMIIKLSEIFECSISYLIYGSNDDSDVETEIKIKLTKEEYQNLDSYLNNNAVFVKDSNQIDTYYQPKYCKFITNDDKPIKEWLRIGKRGNQVILNYKNWYDCYCDEYEVEINDDKSLEKIFNALNFEKIAIVDKKRKIYLYQDKYEFSLDNVKNLGYFVEIEIKKYTSSVLEEYDNLIKLAKRLNLNLDNIDRRGYPYYLLKKDN